MAKHQIFIVHGMGNFKKGWSSDIQTVIKDSYAGYENAAFAPFDDLFEFQELTYNTFFEERREAWKNKAEEINVMLAGNGFTDEAAKKLMDLAGAATGDDFFRTHILDVIMYPLHAADRRSDQTRAAIADPEPAGASSRRTKPSTGRSLRTRSGRQSCTTHCTPCSLTP